jgi:hypothetical protein
MEAFRIGPLALEEPEESLHDVVFVATSGAAHRARDAEGSASSDDRSRWRTGSRDRWRGLWAGLLRWEIDWLADHSIKHYARHIAAAADYAEAGADKSRDGLPQRRAAA